jgi:hypothetical protein
MERQPTVIPWSDLEIAFCNTTPGFRRYLDLDLGRVVTIQVHLLANLTTLQQVTAEPQRFIRIQAIASREQHGWMSRFVATIEDPGLRARLTEAIEGMGAFQRFKQILRAEPAERHRWFELRAALLRAHIEGWLRLQGITACEGPPSPVEDGEAPRAAPEVAPDEMPDETELRSVALAQLQRLPAHVLPSAVGFLRYLETKAT